jgi:hypothetical protein
MGGARRPGGGGGRALAVHKRSLQPPTPMRRGSRLRLVVATIGLPERVLTFTPGVPSMSPNGLVRREKAHAELPTRASSVDGQNMSRGRSEEQLPLPETSSQSWILGLGMNSSVGRLGATSGNGRLVIPGIEPRAR